MLPWNTLYNWKIYRSRYMSNLSLPNIELYLLSLIIRVSQKLFYRSHNFYKIWIIWTYFRRRTKSFANFIRNQCVPHLYCHDKIEDKEINACFLFYKAQFVLLLCWRIPKITNCSKHYPPFDTISQLQPKRKI